MAVKVLEREYTHIDKPIDPVNWLLGNTGVWQRLRLRCKFETVIYFSMVNTLFMEEPNIFTLTNGDNWADHGAEVGDHFIVGWKITDVSNGTITSTGVPGSITAINGSEMISTNTTLGLNAQASNIYPTQLGDKKIHSVQIILFNSDFTSKRPQGIGFRYGHLKNSNLDSHNLASFIDGTFSDFLVDNTDTMSINAIQPFTQLGNKSGMSIYSCDLKYIGPNGYGFVYDIIIVFMISSFFDDINTFEDMISPDVVFDESSLTDDFDITGFITYNNPNIKITNDPIDTKRLGNTGWFNENFNGLPNNFTVTSVDFTNVNNTAVVALDYQNPIKVRAVIDGVPNVTGATQCTFGFAWIPLEETEYKGKTTPFYENIKINTGGSIASFTDVFSVSNAIDATLRTGYSNDGATMDVRNIRFQGTGATQITFEAEFVPSVAFAAFMAAKDETERNFILWVNVADQAKATNQSDRVSLLLAFGTMQTYIEPIGPYNGMEIGFLDHREDENDTPATCGVDMRVEDDLLAKMLFQVDTATGATIPIPTGLIYGVLIQRDADEFQYLLDRYSIDLTQFPSPQQYNFVGSRGFKLGVGNSKNKVEATHYVPLDSGTLKGVRGLYGFKLRWEDWIARNDMPLDVRTVFYDNALKQNGLNNDWYRYLNTAGWTLYFYVYTDAILNGQIVRYVNLKQITFEDYNANADVTATFTYKRESTGGILTGGIDPESGLPLGVILSNELVRLEILWTRTVGTWANVNEVYALNTIEVRGGAGQMEYRQLSSIWLPENDNPLTPLTGATLLDLVLVSPTQIRATCLIDPSKLIISDRYKISGRIGCA